MELDELKNIWKKEPFRRKNDAEIASMLKGRSRSIISKLKRSTWMELIFTLIAGLVLLYYAYTIPNGALKWFFIAFIVIFPGYIIYYIKKINLLNRFDTMNDNLKVSIETLVNDLQTYLKFYKKSYSILYPFYLVLMLLFMAMERGMEDFLHSLTQPRTLISIGFVCLVFVACSLWFTSWYLKKLYGNHLDKLKELLLDLEG